MSIIVAVAKSGMDWPAIAAAGATAVAAVAGIWGTARQARLSRGAATQDLRKSLDAAAENLRLTTGAEEKRLHLSDKRRTYASCLAALNDMTAALAHYSANANLKDVVKSGAAFARMSSIRDSTHNAVVEVELIAPPALGRLVRQHFEWHLELISNIHDNVKISHQNMPKPPSTYWDILKVMRTDLGELD